MYLGRWRTPSDIVLQGHHHLIFTGPDPILVPALTWAVQDVALAGQTLHHVFHRGVARAVVNCDYMCLPAEEQLQVVVPELRALLVQVGVAGMPKPMVGSFISEQQVRFGNARGQAHSLLPACHQAQVPQEEIIHQVLSVHMPLGVGGSPVSHADYILASVPAAAAATTRGVHLADGSQICGEHLISHIITFSLPPLLLLLGGAIAGIVVGAGPAAVFPAHLEASHSCCHIEACSHDWGAKTGAS